MTWRYSPEDYLGDLNKLVVIDYELDISHAEIKVTIPEHVYDSTTKAFYEVKKILESIFDSAMVVNNVAYSIKCTNINNYPSNGQVGVVLWPENCVCTSFVESISIKQYDENGKLVYDQEEEDAKKIKADIEEKKELSSIFVSLSVGVLHDELANKMVSSYKKSLENDKYTLVHLYEIRDALNIHFKHKKEAIKALNISKDIWGKIGELANSKAVKGSRHEGKYSGQLAEPSEAFIKEARESAKQLIQAYYVYRQNMLYRDRTPHH